MRRFARHSALCLALVLAPPLAAPAVAGPNPQLVASVEHRLRTYGIEADVSRYDTATVARLHLTMVQRGRWVHKRRELIHILRKAEAKL